jgi:hypothetical protein
MGFMMDDFENKIELLINEIDTIISVLSQELSDEDVKHGWIEYSREKWLNWFVKLKVDIIEVNLDFPHGIPSAILRAMDFDGISGGDIVSRAATISMLIREIYEGDI